MSNVLYTPFRSIGYVCDKNQFVVNRLGEENFLTVTIGNCFQIFRLNHKLAVCLVSKPLQSSQSSIGLSSYRISSIQTGGHETFAAVGCSIFVYNRTNIVRTYNVHNFLIIGLLCVGNILLSYDEKNYLKIVSLKKREVIGELKFLGTSIITSMIHPSTYINKFLVGFSDGQLELWNFSSKKLIFKFSSHVRYLSNRRKKSSSNRKSSDMGLSIVSLSDSDSDSEIVDSSGVAVSSIEQSPACDVVAVGFTSGDILLLNIRLDLVLFSFQQMDGAVTSLTFRTDGASERYPFLVSSSENGRLHTWNLGTLKETDDMDLTGKTFRIDRKLQFSIDDAHRGPISKVAFLHGEPVMVSSGADNSIKMWIFDAPDGSARLLRSREGHSSHPLRIRYYGGNSRVSTRDSADASSCEVISAGSDGTLRTFNTAVDTQNREFSQSPLLKKLGLSQRNLRLPDCVGFDVTESRERDWANMVTIHRGQSAAYVWNYKNRVATETILSQPHWKGNNLRHVPNPTNVATAVAVSACGHFCVVGSAGGMVYKYNLQSGLPRNSFPRVGRLDSELSGDIEKKATVPGNVYYEEKKITAEWSSRVVLDASLVKSGHTDEVVGLFVESTNATMVSCGLDGQLIFWNFLNHIVLEAKQLGTPLTLMHGHRDAGFVAVCGLDAVVRVFDISTHALCRRFVHESIHSSLSTKSVKRQLLDVAFTPDGRRFLSSAADCTLRVWDMPTGRCLNWLQFSAPVQSMAVSLSGENLCIALADADKVGVYMYIDRSLYETVHFWKEPTTPTAVADCELHSEEENDGMQTKNPQLHREAEFNHDSDDEQALSREGVTVGDLDVQLAEDGLQKSAGCITLSSVPKAHWTTLFHLEAIKRRSKPVDPPAKRPQAPFFLPSVVTGGSTPSFPTPQEYQKILKQQQQQSTTAVSTEEINSVEPIDANKKQPRKRAHFASEVAVVEEDAVAEAGPLPSVWNDDEEDGDGEGVGWRIDTTSGPDDVHDEVVSDGDEGEASLSVPPTEVTKSRSSDRSTSKILRRKDKLPRCKMAAFLENMSASSDAFSVSSDSLLEYMKGLPAPATDVELRSLCMFAEDSEGLQLLQVFLQWLTAQVSSGKDFELLQAYLHRTLTIYDQMLVDVPALAEQLQMLKEANEQASDRFRHLVQKNLCMLKVLANISVL